MRLPYRNKKTTLWVVFAVIVVTMFLFKFTELRPICFFKDETSSSVMVRGDSILYEVVFHDDFCIFCNQSDDISMPLFCDDDYYNKRQVTSTHWVAKPEQYYLASERNHVLLGK
uniref:Uncharacterized protein n=1 Tax=Glossina brevipalpis TaxID=37001 RepID=A0A1A9WX54_9MUSC